MKLKMKILILMGSLLLLVFAVNLGIASAAGPTCSGTLVIANHGQHVVGAYVVGEGVDWPPSGGVVGTGGKAALPGGPAAHGHFQAESPVAPGASFCLSQSQSPGDHPGP